MKSQKSNEGYTLVELVIVMVLILVVGGMIAQILVSTLRGSNKTKANNAVSQNGNYALSIMSDFIINAKSFTSILPLTPTPAYSCAGTTITGNSVTIQTFDGGTTTFMCDDVNKTISSNSASLLDTSQVSLVPGSCSFTCTQASVYAPPRIDITFKLQNAYGNSAENKADVTFNTSLSVRNYGLK